MSNKRKPNKKLAALNMAKLPVSQVILDVKDIITKMTNNVHFPNPSPALSVIANQLSNLQAAFDQTKARAVGSVSKMHTEREILMADLKLLVQYVESEAGKDPDNAENIIQSSGFSVRKSAQREPKTFKAVPGKLSGSVVLDTKAVKGSIYVYQMSTDPSNPNSWMEIYKGTIVKFTKTGLTIGTHIYLRVAVLDKVGQGDFGSPISYIVV